MSLNRLEMSSDLASPQGRGQLDETLALVADAIKHLRADMEKVKDADKIVRPVPITAYPMAAGQVYTGEEGGEIGDITWRAVQETPTGTLLCNGSAVSRTTYSDLFSKIGTTFGSGDGSTTFNIPNLQRRVIVGVGGTGTSTLSNTVGSTGGAETVTLTTSQIPSHNHGMGNHTHDISHTHTSDFWQAGGGSPNDQPSRTANGQNQAGYSNNVSQSTSTSGVPSTNTSDNTGGGSSHNNMQPSIVMAPYIRYRLGPTDTIQTLPISWGAVNAQWRLDTLKNFPVSSHSNLHTVVVTGDRPGAVVRISAAGATQSGNSSENKIVGIVALPYNFRKFKTDALKIATKVSMTGCAAATSATVTLRVSDPVTAGAYLADTYTRTINVSAGTIADSEYVDAKLTAESLGKDWKAGYLLRFEILWSIPKTFTTASLDVGFLEIGWQ